MPYMIDGHNLIGKLPDISLTDPNDEALLIQKLSGYAAGAGKQIVVVFDHGLPGGSSRMSTRVVHVVFASGRSSADRVMIERIGKVPDPLNWTVVTSDREVMAVARSRKMKTLYAEEFVTLLEAPVKRVVDAGEASDIQLSDAEVDEWLNVFGDGRAAK